MNEIYKKSWWGNAHLNKIGFGNIMFPKTPTFISRVLSDGGVVEGEKCQINEQK